jgi:DNA polymerase-3 subunit delta
MKATQRDFASMAPRAAQSMRIFFLCGTDDASVQDAAFRIASLLPDAGERVEFSGAELKRDPVRLGMRRDRRRCLAIRAISGCAVPGRGA